LGSHIEASFHNIVKERKGPYLDLWLSEKSNLSHLHKEDSLFKWDPFGKTMGSVSSLISRKGIHLGRLSNIRERTQPCLTPLQ